MGNDMDPRGATPRLVTFWASMVDSFLQDFQKAVAEQDQRGVMLASAKLAQAGASMEDTFTSCVTAGIETEEDVEACNVATEAVGKVVDEEMNILLGSSDDNGPDTTRTYN